MKLVITNNYEEMSREAATVIADLVRAKSDCVLGLATGSTPEGLYACLAQDYNQGLLDFKYVQSFNLDEYRGLEHSHTQSYHYFMNKHLFSKINIKPEHTHVPDGSNSHAEEACSEYERAIEEAGGIDLQLLGLGHNGHIGFNEPADEFVKVTNCVDLTESTITANSRLFNSLDEVPRQAYTMGIGTIMKARKILVVANGKGKAEIVKKAFFGPVSPLVPASVLQFHHDVVVIVDKEAASLL